MTFVRALLVSLLLVPIGAACVVVPYNIRTSTRPSLASAAREHLVVGVTTMEDVLLRFGEPEEQLDGAAPVFRYRWGRSSGVGVTAFTWNREVTGGAAKAVGYALRIDFGPDARVRSYQVEETVSRP